MFISVIRIIGSMAKKKRRVAEEKEEEYEFKPAEFDEREFILKDIYGTKVLFVITGLAIVTGIVGALFCIMSKDYGWVAATALGFLIVLVMKKLLLIMKFRVDLLDNKTMLMNYFLFLSLSLGIGIMLINVPFV